MEVYVIRHGQSAANSEAKFSGWSQSPLTALGREQARKTGERLKTLKFDRIYSSDQCRARQTTELVFPGREYTTDWRLREINVGPALEEKKRTECMAQYGDLLSDALSRRDFTCFGGESYAQQVERVAAFMKDLEDIPEEEQIAVVCHGGSIASMLGYVLGTQLPQSLVQVENASVTCFRWLNGNWKLLRWSDTGNIICENGTPVKMYSN